ncbi:hypothetical protein BASA81_001921 [Batrachochytrium salamandrivorans]|nr:hypothetical protein BASA81_001921 [Batrachochytrium salamandrivorans]
MTTRGLQASLAIWEAINSMGNQWRKLDQFIHNGKHDAMLDSLVGSLRAKNVFHPSNYFQDGFGDRNATMQIGNEFFHTLSQPDYRPNPIDSIQFGTKSKVGNKAYVQECSFSTSAKAISHILPKECLQARFLLVSPESCTKSHDNSPNPGSLGPTVILLAGTGEHSFGRRASLAIPLAERAGISSIILESPYYGSRRPRHQPGAKLRTVSDLPTLGRCTIEETASLIRYFLIDNGFSTDICTAGVSMGGLHAAMSASAFPQTSIGVVSWLGPPSAVAVFTEGLLSQYCEWLQLQRELLTKDATEGMKRFLHITDIDNFPKPCNPNRAILVLAENDLFVPFPHSQAKWNSMIQNKWNGAQVRVVPGGHVSATLFGAESMRRCIEKVLRVVDHEDPLVYSSSSSSMA